MRKVLSLVVLPFLFIACDDLKGDFEALQNLEFKNRKGETVEVATGNYDAVIKFNSKKKMTLQLEQGEDKIKAEFRIPKGVEFPNNDTIELTAKQVEQNYDVTISDVNNVSISDIRRDFESCTVRVPVRRCRRRPDGGTVCWVDYVSRWGNRTVDYRLETTSGTKLMTLSEEGSDVGEFNADYRKSVRRYEFIGRCHLRGPFPYYP